MSPPSSSTPVPTTYALLGLLALQPWTAYELAQQTGRSLGWFFPRAERGVYTEAKRLVALGWATSEPTWTGRRRATSYAITPAGTTALTAWLAERGAPLQVESEELLRFFLAGPGELASARAATEAIGAGARDQLDGLAHLADGWLSGDGELFRDRGATNAVAMRLLTDLHRAVADWAVWAEQRLDELDQDSSAADELATTVFTAIARDARAR